MTFKSALQRKAVMAKVTMKNGHHHLYTYFPEDYKVGKRKFIPPYHYRLISSKHYLKHPTRFQKIDAIGR